MTVTLNRSDIEFSKRVFLDRLTVDAQPLAQPADIDSGPGLPYDYAGVYNPYDFGIAADCSGANSINIPAAIMPGAMNWQRQFSTETFGSWGAPKGFRQTNAADLLGGNYPIKVWIMHGGGGPNSHMMCMIDGWQMESNGDSGTCTAGHGGTSLTDSIWNDWWVLDATINEDTPYRQVMGYPRGADFAGGRPGAAALRAAGYTFVCRYLTDGGPGLPGKLLLPAEYADYMANGIDVVFNYETSATFILSDSGSADAQAALAQIESMPGAPAQPVVYFSADWDESEAQQATVNKYLSDAARVLGGPQYVGIYGAYYVCKRALDAGVCKYMWQAEAWSGFPDAPHVDSRVHIIQRNRLGNPVVGGVQLDINEAHSGDIGAAKAATQPIVVGPGPGPVPNQPSSIDLTDGQYLRLGYEQLAGPRELDGYGHGWEQLGDGPDSSTPKRSDVDFFAKYKPMWDDALAKWQAAQPTTPPVGGSK